MIAFRLAFFATAALAAPAAEAEADPQLLLGGLGYHHVAVPVCKTVPKTVVIGQRCHVEPNCATEDVVVGQHVTAPLTKCAPAQVCEDVTAEVPEVVCGEPAALTKCAPAQVCEDVPAEVPEVVCGEPAAAEEAVEE